MKNLKVLAFVLVFVISTTSLFATDVVPDIPVKQIRTQVADLFVDADFTIEKEIIVNIVFTFSSEGDIVVLKVDSKDRDVLDYVSKYMNHKMIQTPGEPNRLFTLPLRITKS
ncbi:MAG: hypothetical protein IZT56_02155 [Bacteroidetes bacterium]|nr:hypothetical protein [Bacteroidota bacterium]